MAKFRIFWHIAGLGEHEEIVSAKTKSEAEGLAYEALLGSLEECSQYGAEQVIDEEEETI